MIPTNHLDYAPFGPSFKFLLQYYVSSFFSAYYPNLSPLDQQISPHPNYHHHVATTKPATTTTTTPTFPPPLLTEEPHHYPPRRLF